MYSITYYKEIFPKYTVRRIVIAPLCEYNEPEFNIISLDD